MTLPDIVAASRRALTLRSRFYAAIALGLDWIEEPAIRTMATDGARLWFNTDWCRSIGIENTMGAIAHECLHVVNKHHLRMGGREIGPWNTACDLAINEPLKRDGFKLPETMLADTDGRFQYRTAEYIYDSQQLARPAPKAPEQPGNPGQDQNRGQGQNDSPNKNNEPTEDPAGSETSPRTGSRPGKPASGIQSDKVESEKGKAVAPAEIPGEIRAPTDESGKPLSPSQLRQAEDRLDRRIQQAAAMAKRAGQWSGEMESMVAASLDRVDWRDRFKTIAGGAVRSRISWSRPNRRFVQHGLVLPSMTAAGPGRVACVLDVSGSLTAAELAAHTGTIVGLIEETRPDEVALIQCDAKVTRIDFLSSGETPDTIEVKGGGGTRFQPAFDWIAENFPADLIVYATDLECFDKPEDPGVPTIWVTPSTHRKGIFGDTIVIDRISA
jgi:predicted metal-dependent peptidase